jgi:phage FluMu protein Com
MAARGWESTAGSSRCPRNKEICVGADSVSVGCKERNSANITHEHEVSSRKSLLLLERAALEFNDEPEDNP